MFFGNASALVLIRELKAYEKALNLKAY